MKVITRTVRFHNRTVIVRMVGKTYSLQIEQEKRIEKHKLLSRDQAGRYLGSNVMDVLDAGENSPEVINVLPIQITADV